MTKKIEDGGFVIEIPKEVLDAIPFMFRGFITDFIDKINRADLNHDQKRDVAQYAPFVIKAIPILLEFLSHVDPGRAKNFIMGSGLLKPDPTTPGKSNKTAAALLDQLLAIFDEAKELAATKEAKA